MEHVTTSDPDSLALLIVQQYLQEQGFTAGQRNIELIMHEHSGTPAKSMGERNRF